MHLTVKSIKYFYPWEWGREGEGRWVSNCKLLERCFNLLPNNISSDAEHVGVDILIIKMLGNHVANLVNF